MPPFYITNTTDKPISVGGELILNDGRERIYHLMPAHVAQLREMGLEPRQQTPEEAIFEKVGLI